MNLIIDAGNTSVKLAAFNQGRLLEQLQVPNNELPKAVDELIEMFPGIKHGIVASVSFLEEDQLQAIASKLDLYIVDHKLEVPFNNEYSSPETLGADRIGLIAAAVLHYADQNTLVIDAGTCITYDMITAKNNYLGGAISPGLQMRYQSLAHYTERLPNLQPADFPDLTGNSTDNSIHSGVINGTCQEIDGVIEQYQTRYEDLTVILTGGDAQFLSKTAKKSHICAF